MTFSRLSSPLRCCLHYDFVERAATARRGGYYTNVSACDSRRGGDVTLALRHILHFHLSAAS